MQGDSTAEMKRAYSRAVDDLPEEIKIGNNRLGFGPFLNAMAAYFLSLEPPERENFARAAIGELFKFDPNWGVDEAQQKSPDEAGPRAEPGRQGNPALAEFVTRRVDMKTGRIIDPHADDVVVPKAKSRKKA